MGIRPPDAISQDSDEGVLVRLDTYMPHSMEEDNSLGLPAAFRIGGDEGGEGDHVREQVAIEGLASIGDAAKLEVRRDEGVNEAGLLVTALVLLGLGDGGVDGSPEGNILVLDSEAEEEAEPVRRRWGVVTTGFRF